MLQGSNQVFGGNNFDQCVRYCPISFQGMRQSKCLITYTNSFLSLMNSSIAETLEKHWFVVTKNKDPTLEGRTEQWKSEGTTRSNTGSLRHHHTIKSVLFSVHRIEIFNCATVNLSCILHLPFYIPSVLMCKPDRTVTPLEPLAIPCCSALRLVNPTLLCISSWSQGLPSLCLKPYCYR